MKIWGGLSYAIGTNLYILYFLESISICAVNLFVLISGYFMCERQKRTLAKPFELLVRVVLFAEAGYFATAIIHNEKIGMKHIIGRLIPSNWFVILYITLYLLSPFINIVICEAQRKGVLKKLVMLTLLLFSIYPTTCDMLCEVTHKEFLGLSSVGMYGSQRGYTIVNFVMMYIVGAYLRKNPDSVRGEKSGFRFVMLATVLTVWVVLGDKLGINAENNAWEYCNPLIIWMAVEAFRLFQKIDMGCNKVVNYLAGASFTVYLMHAQFFRFLAIPKFVIKNPVAMLIHIVASVMAVYLICVVIDEVYHKVTAVMFKRLYRKLDFLQKDLF